MPIYVSLYLCTDFLNRGPKSILKSDLRSNTTSKQTKHKYHEDVFNLPCKNKTAQAALSIQCYSYGGAGRLIDIHMVTAVLTKTNELRGLSQQAKCTYRATAACRRSSWQILQIEGSRDQRNGSPRPCSRFSRPRAAIFPFNQN
jgi:hypothetical protein